MFRLHHLTSLHPSSLLHFFTHTSLSPPFTPLTKPSSPHSPHPPLLTHSPTHPPSTPIHPPHPSIYLAHKRQAHSGGSGSSGDIHGMATGPLSATSRSASASTTTAASAAAAATARGLEEFPSLGLGPSHAQSAARYVTLPPPPSSLS